MTTTKDDQPRHRETRPDGAMDARRQADTRAAGTPAATQNNEKSAADPSQEFDPWKFGAHPVAAELRAEILANGFPASPDGGGFWEEVKKAKPSEPADSAAQGQPDGAKKSARETDTLRLRRAAGVPIEHPLREAAPWLVLAAIGTIILLWLLMGHEKPKPSVPDTATTSGTAPKLPTVSPTDERATVPGVPSEPSQPSGADNGAPSLPVPDAATPGERTERKPPKRGSPAAPGTPKAEPRPIPQAPSPSVTPAPSSNTRQFSIGPR